MTNSSDKPQTTLICVDQNAHLSSNAVKQSAF